MYEKIRKFLDWSHFIVLVPIAPIIISGVLNFYKHRPFFDPSEVCFAMLLITLFVLFDIDKLDAPFSSIVKYFFWVWLFIFVSSFTYTKLIDFEIQDSKDRFITYASPVLRIPVPGRFIKPNPFSPLPEKPSEEKIVMQAHDAAQEIETINSYIRNRREVLNLIIPLSLMVIIFTVIIKFISLSELPDK